MFVRFFGIALFISVCCGTKVSIRIVDEASSYNFGNDLIQPEIRLGPLLFPRKTPSNFSGPDHLRHLVGKCFDIVSGKYKYVFCPFNNVTQVELGNQWNPYRGILGVWQEWEIVNGTFHSMIFRDGDSCSNVYREVQVSMTCKETNKILSVSEPDKCRYALEFATPHVCHPQSMLVFPRLPQPLQAQWEDLLTQFTQNDITEKGYKIGMRNIFVQAGFQLPELPGGRYDIHPPTNIASGEAISFSSIHQCKSEYDKLLKEVESLRILLALKDVGEDHQKS